MSVVIDFLNGSESFAMANNSLVALYNPTVVMYVTGGSEAKFLTLILLPETYVLFELCLLYTSPSPRD